MKVLKSTLLLTASILLSATIYAANYPFTATYSGTQEVPPNASPGTGTIVGVYNDVTNTIIYTITFSGLMTNTSDAHFHGPAASGVTAGVQIAHTGFPLGVTSGTYSRMQVLTALQETQLMSGLWYSNIHTTGIPAGEIRAQIVLGAASTEIYTYTRQYSGLNEVPPNNSPATGTITGAYNAATNTIFYAITFSGLGSNAAAAHFHGPAIPGVNAAVVFAHSGFPTGVTSGSNFGSNVLSNAQETDLLNGLWYSNIHSVNIPSGEIRAQIFFDAPFVAPVISCPGNIVTGTDLNVCTASESFMATATGTPVPLISYRIGTTIITSPHVFPLGTTTVTATAINGGGVSTCTFTVTVNDTQAPAITGLSASPNMLWPPNHKMRDVNVAYNTTDNCPGTVTCTISVTSNEAVGATTPDWIVVNNHNVKLRAERDGNGTGRVYTITVTCRDAANNTTTSTTTVDVPHDMSVTRPGDLEETGISNLFVKAGPNPSGSYFTLDIRSVSSEKVEVRITDISGKIVVSESYQANNLVKTGQDLKSGMYFLTVRQGSEIVQMKLVKQ